MNEAQRGAFAGMVACRDGAHQMLQRVEALLEIDKQAIWLMRFVMLVGLAYCVFAAMQYGTETAWIWGVGFGINAYTVLHFCIPAERSLARGRKLASNLRNNLKEMDAAIAKAKAEMMEMEQQP